MKQMIMGKINNHSTSCDVRIVYILNYVKKNKWKFNDIQFIYIL